MANSVAPEGRVWVCLACGKTSQDKYGLQKHSYGWDESCMVNAKEFGVEQLSYHPGSSCVKEILSETH